MAPNDASNPAFELDTRIEVKIERELASYVGSLILRSDTSNTAAVAFGYQLKRLSGYKDDNDPEDPQSSTT